MNIEIDLEDIEQFVMSEEFRDFLLSHTTEFGTAAFILQTLLESIEELKVKEKEQEYKNRNVDREGEWEISSDGYYPYCPFCGGEYTERGLSFQCPSCGAHLNYNKFNFETEIGDK